MTVILEGESDLNSPVTVALTSGEIIDVILPGVYCAVYPPSMTNKETEPPTDQEGGKRRWGAEACGVPRPS